MLWTSTRGVFACRPPCRLGCFVAVIYQFHETFLHRCATASSQRGSPAMNRADLTEKILDVKREKGWTWKHICEQIGGLSPMLITGALLGQMKLPQPAP